MAGVVGCTAIASSPDSGLTADTRLSAGPAHTPCHRLVGRRTPRPPPAQPPRQPYHRPGQAQGMPRRHAGPAGGTPRASPSPAVPSPSRRPRSPVAEPRSRTCPPQPPWPAQLRRCEGRSRETRRAHALDHVRITAELNCHQSVVLGHRLALRRDNDRVEPRRGPVTPCHRAPARRVSQGHARALGDDLGVRVGASPTRECNGVGSERGAERPVAAELSPGATSCFSLPTRPGLTRAAMTMIRPRVAIATT